MDTDTRDNTLPDEEVDLENAEHNNFVLSPKPSPSSWWTWWYLVDWSLVVLVLAIERITDFATEPYHRYLPEPHTNPTVMYPLRDSIVPAWALLIIALFCPAFVISLMQILFRSWHDLHHGLLSLFEALCLTDLLTNALKLYCGRYRPDWIHKVQEGQQAGGRRSFPSGHSSLSFAGLTVLSLYLAGKLGIWRRNGGAFWKLLIILIPIWSACLVAGSRTRDYHHHFADIVAGSAIGFGMAVVCYFANYHRLSSQQSHLPKTRSRGPVIYRP